MGKYPLLVIDLKKLKSNILEIKKLCDKENIEIAGVIKGASGIPEIAETFDKEDISYIASSRIEQFKNIKDRVTKPFLLIRIPMLSEVEDVIRLCDASLNSEIKTLKALNEEAKKQNKIHNVILMLDQGDLREGFMTNEDIIEASLIVENDLSNLCLLGIGSNYSCYGSTVPTEEKLNDLVKVAESIEEKIGRKLKYISGGGSTSIPRLYDGNMPKRINLLRIGETILDSKDLTDLWGYNQDFLNRDVFTLKAEVIEVKDKPTYPIGELFVDAFGNKPEYEDKGIRKKALIALGKVDYAYIDDLIIKEEGAFVVGASSDHTIIDIEDAKRDIQVGDIIEFGVHYGAMVFTTHSDNIKKEFIN